MEKQAPQFYVTPFSATYWRASLSEFNNLRSLVLAALLVGLRVAAGLIIPEHKDLIFLFITTALCGYLCGPLVGLVAGASSDTISFLLTSSGPYFPGFLLCEMLEYFLFALFLYRSKVSVLRLGFALLSVNAIVKIALTSVFLNFMYGQGFLVLFVPRVIKNAILLLPQTAVLAVIFAALLPAIKKMRVVPVASEKVTFF